MADPNKEWEEQVENRGAPTKAEDEKLTERFSLGFTKAEMKALIIHAASADGGPYDVKEWAKMVLLMTVNGEDPT